MKHNPLRFFLTLSFIIFFSFSLSEAQQVQEQKLRQFSQEKTTEWQQQRQEAEEIAERIGLPLRIELESGKVIELQRFENNHPVYYETHNLNGAVTSSVDAIRPGGDLGLELTGDTQTLGIWDGGKVRTTHQEFGNRVTQQDDETSLSGHATHVGGTMVAAGVQENAQGMAYEAELDAHSWSNDLGEVSDAAADGMLVSNHSYGLLMGWSYNQDEEMWDWWGDVEISETEDYRYGFYNHFVRNWDQVAYNAPHYQIVQSAGNSRLQGPADQPVEHRYIDPETGTWTTSETVRDLDGGPDGYQSIGGRAVAKNVLTVGAVEGIEGGYESPEDVVMSSFSSWGPTDDGRLKPEIVAKGVNVYSTFAGDDSDYGAISGTSMSSPMVSGTIGLLQELYQNFHDEPPLSSTIRALLIHTTDETGFDEGPDYRFGYGLMNAERAAQTLQSAALEGERDVVEEVTLQDGETFEYTLSSDGEDPLLATIAWTDPEGEALEPQLNPDDIILVNDLDLRIEDPDGSLHEPYVLDPQNPGEPATTGDNHVDNMEQVFVEEPESGDYIVRISHKDDLQGGQQDVSLIITDDGVEPFEDPFAGGVGSKSNPYQIENAEQLDEVRNFLSFHFILTDDIDLSDYDQFDPIASLAFTDDGPVSEEFQGTFDGNGHTVSNLTVSGLEDETAALFGLIGSNAVVENINLEDVDVQGEHSRTAALAAANLGQIKNVSASGQVESQEIITGGLVAQNQGLIQNADADVNVDGDETSGGLVGWNAGLGHIEYSQAHGNVGGGINTGGLLGINDQTTSVINSSASGEVTGDTWVGGLIGDSYRANVIASFATGDVFGQEQAGGLIGSKNGLLIDSYAHGNVEVDDLGGGLIALLYHEDDVAEKQSVEEVDTGNYNKFDQSDNNRDNWDIETFFPDEDNSGEITLHTSYSTGSVTSDTYEGGLIGMISDPEAEVMHNYWDTDRSGLEIGVDEGSSEGVTGLETDEMIDENAFSYMEGFNFVDTWKLVESDYPALDWEDVEAIEPPSRDITFRVNMEVQHEMGFFRPEDTEDQIRIIGDFNSWNSDNYQLEPVDDNEFIYAITVSVQGGEGDEIEYKFQMASGDGRALPDQGVEIIGDNPDENRHLTLEEPDEEMDPEIVYFSDQEETEPVFAGGEGTSDNPFEIADTANLEMMRYFPYAHFIQTDDIDASGLDNFVPLYFNGIPAFNGEYDGDGHDISNLSIVAENDENTGLFREVGPDGVVKDLAIIGSVIESNSVQVGALAGMNFGEIAEVSVDATVSGMQSVGAIAGSNFGLIENIDVTADVTAEAVAGGVVGLHGDGGTIQEAKVDGTVSGSELIGGAVGMINQGEVSRTQVEAEVTGEELIGGLSGISLQGLIYGSSAHGDVTGEFVIGGLTGGNARGRIEKSFTDNRVSGIEMVGGIAGIADGEIFDSYSIAKISDGNQAGGILGGFIETEDSETVAEEFKSVHETHLKGLQSSDEQEHSGSENISESQMVRVYSAVMHGSQDFGALVGFREDNTSISSSYWSSAVSNVESGVSEGSSEGATELGVTEMLDPGSFENWDFDDVWTMDAGETMPYLQEFGYPVDAPASYIQLVHNSADPELDELEVKIEDEMQLKLNYLSATEFKEIYPGEHKIAVRTTEDEPDTLMTDTFTVGNSHRSQITVAGVHQVDNFSGNPDERITNLHLNSVTQISEQASDDEQIAVRIGHTSTDLQTVDLLVEESDILADTLSLGEWTDHMLLDPEHNNWRMTDSETGDLIDDFRFSLEDMTGETVIAQTSGFLEPSANQDGASLGMIAVQADGTVHEADIVTATEEGSDIPDQVELSQNYPNPFNPATTIEYAIPEETEVRLEVYNILGERVTVLVEETAQPGTYEATWNASEMASGVYIYRLQAGDKTYTRQMTFVK